MKDDCDRDIMVGENRFYLGEDNILYVFHVGNVGDNDIIEVKRAMYKLISSGNGLINVLINLNKAEKPSAKSRRGFAEILESEKVGKVAVFGAHRYRRIHRRFI